MSNFLFQKRTDTEEIRKKQLKTILVFIIAVFIIFTLKLFSLQVIQGTNFLRQSQTISQRQRIIPSQRGEIYDRNVDFPLVVNVDSFAVDLIPGEIPSGMYDTVTLRLSQYLGVSKAEIDKKIPINERKTYTSFELKSHIDFSVISKIAENLHDLPGVSWRKKPLRSYVTATSMSHVLGYVGDITKDELKMLYNKGYTNSSIIGKTGIEKQYDDLLQGKQGLESRVVDVKERKLTENTMIEEPLMGNTLVLTIDSEYQQLAEKALGERIGSAIVLKPATGEVLAMVSYPFFDANMFSSEGASAYYSKLFNDNSKPMLNRSINAAYSPASTFKVVMTTALLAEESFSSESKIECAGVLRYGDRDFHCHVKQPGHGWLDLKNGLAQSCNIYYWTIGRDYLGVDKISSYANEFGFGSSQEIDLPSQAAGFVPTAQWKERRFHEKWVGGDTMNLSIGQGFLEVTPMQVANMMAMVVNEGKIYQPHILKEVLDPVTKEVIQAVEPKVLFSSAIDNAVWKDLQEALHYTATDGSASSVLMKNKVVQIAGKTGTAEVANIRDSWHSWFVAYGPFDAPKEEQVVVCVMVEAVNDWEWWAPYASTIIFQGIFGNQSYDEAIDALGFRYLVKPIGRQE